MRPILFGASQRIVEVARATCQLAVGLAVEIRARDEHFVRLAQTEHDAAQARQLALASSLSRAVDWKRSETAPLVWLRQAAGERRRRTKRGKKKKENVPNLRLVRVGLGDSESKQHNEQHHRRI